MAGGAGTLGRYRTKSSLIMTSLEQDSLPQLRVDTGSTSDAKLREEVFDLVTHHSALILGGAAVAGAYAFVRWHVPTREALTTLGERLMPSRISSVAESLAEVSGGIPKSMIPPAF